MATQETCMTAHRAIPVAGCITRSVPGRVRGMYAKNRAKNANSTSGRRAAALVVTPRANMVDMESTDVALLTANWENIFTVLKRRVVKLPAGTSHRGNSGH